MLMNFPMPNWLMVELEPVKEDDRSELPFSLDLRVVLEASLPKSSSSSCSVSEARDGSNVGEMTVSIPGKWSG